MHEVKVGNNKFFTLLLRCIRFQLGSPPGNHSFERIEVMSAMVYVPGLRRNAQCEEKKEQGWFSHTCEDSNFLQILP